MTAAIMFARFRAYMVGSAGFMNLPSCFELGIIDVLRASLGLTAAALGDAVGAKAEVVEQLLYLPVREGFIDYDESGGVYCLGRSRGRR